MNSQKDRFDLLVFDWDGTLMDSEARIVACMQAAATDLSIRVPDRGEARNIIGLGLKEAVMGLYPDLDAPTVDQMVLRYRHHYLVANNTPTELFGGAEQVLEELAEAGFLLAVATGKGHRGLQQSLEQTGLGPLFHATRCADQTLSKPHPEMLLQLLDELGTDRRRTLMIGDTEYDMQMAGNAGVAGLAVSYGVHSRERLLSHSPLGCIDDIRELTRWLTTAATPSA